MVYRLRRFLLRSWPLLVSLAVLAGTPYALQLNRHGRVAVKAALLLPDMMVRVPLPYRPIDLFSDPPGRERVTIDYMSREGPRSIEADLYIPASGGARAGAVFSMGAPPLELDDKRLIRIAEDFARAGVVMLVPFSERLDDHEIEPEEIDALVAEFQYVQALPGVDRNQVGFFGVSVGGSLALVAAADPRIADDVDYVVSFGGYYDALDAFGAIATHHIRYEDIDESWTPRRHAATVIAEQIIFVLEDPGDRALLTRVFVDREPHTSEELASLTPVGRRSYDFLANEDPDAVRALSERLPADAIEKFESLSPQKSIDRVRAELFIVHDRGDPFIPYTESRRLQDHLRGRETPRTHFDELRLFEHVEPRFTQRPDIIALDSTRLILRLYQLLLRWD